MGISDFLAYTRYNTMAHCAHIKARDVDDMLLEAQNSLGRQQMQLNDMLSSGLSELDAKYGFLFRNLQSELREATASNNQNKINEANWALKALENERAAAENNLRAKAQSAIRGMQKPTDYADISLKSQSDHWHGVEANSRRLANQYYKWWEQGLSGNNGQNA